MNYQKPVYLDNAVDLYFELLMHSREFIYLFLQLREYMDILFITFHGRPIKGDDMDESVWLYICLSVALQKTYEQISIDEFSG